VALSDLFLKIRNSPKIFVGRIAGTAWPAESDSPQSLTSQSRRHCHVRLQRGPDRRSPGHHLSYLSAKMRFAAAQSAFLRGQRFGARKRRARSHYGVGSGWIARFDRARDCERSPGRRTHALAATKELLHTVPSLSLSDAFSWTSQLSSELFASDQAQEELAAS